MLRDGFHFGAGGGEAGAAGEAADKCVIPNFALLHIRGLDERHPHIGVTGELKAMRHDPDHHSRLLVDANGLADDGGIFGVTIFPEAIGDDGNGSGALALVFSKEVAAGDGPLADHGKSVRRDLSAPIALRIAGGVTDVGAVAGERGHGFERLHLRAVVKKIGIRDVVGFTVGAIDAGDIEDAFAVAERKVLVEDGVREREDSGVQANSERESEDGHGGEARVVGQGAEGVLDVLPERAHGRDPLG